MSSHISIDIQTYSMGLTSVEMIQAAISRNCQLRSGKPHLSLWLNPCNHSRRDHDVNMYNFLQLYTLNSKFVMAVLMDVTAPNGARVRCQDTNRKNDDYKDTRSK